MRQPQWSVLRIRCRHHRFNAIHPAVLNSSGASDDAGNNRLRHIGDRDRSGPVEIAVAPCRWGNRGHPEYRHRRRYRRLPGICHRDTWAPDIAGLPDLVERDNRSGSRARHGR